jgi:hypothetical protein
MLDRFIIYMKSAFCKCPTQGATFTFEPVISVEGKIDVTITCLKCSARLFTKNVQWGFNFETGNVDTGDGTKKQKIIDSN